MALYPLVPAFISAAAAIAVCVANNYISHLNSSQQQARMVSLVDYRLKQLEVKVEKHNNLVERMTKAEVDMQTAFHKLDSLEEDIKERS